VDGTLLLDNLEQMKMILLYRAFHGFGQTKFADGGSILSSSQFTLLPQLSLKNDA